jgi:thiamine pyrophosphokinase
MAPHPQRILLLCNGEPPSKALARALSRQADQVYAADGGANTARVLGVRPDVIVGDLDSITSATRRYFSSARVVHVARQDNTDLEKALDEIAGQGRSDVMILGATGNRLDFTLANLAVLWKYIHALTITVRGDGWRALPVRGRAEIVAARGTTVSLIPFGICRGITLAGMKYPLRDGTMNVGEVGVSNVVAGSPCTVRVREGHMLVVLFRDDRRGGARIRW